MDFVVVPDNTPPATSRTRDLIEGLKCHSLVCSAWFLRHTRSTRCIRLPLCALNERALKRSSSLRYKLSTEYQFEGYRELLQLPSVVDTNFHVINRSSESYQYEALPNGKHFRCFELSPGDWDAPLNGRMVVHSFDEEPDYEAVSYTWDGVDPVALLDCGAGEIGITSSVVVLLRRLRLTNQPRKLWIDSICINQSDSSEKGAQVRLMSSIYGACSRLVIWLGEEDKSTQYAVDMLGTLDSVVDQAWNASHGNWPSFESLRAGGLPAKTDPRWLCLQTLLHNRWFTRTWILQEVSLATNPWVQRGSFTFDWKKIVRIVLCLTRAYVPGFYNINLKNAYILSYFCSSRSWWHDPSLISLLHKTTNCLSTLKVDRVFALLGLSAEKHDLEHLVKYSSDGTEDVNDVKEVYTAVAIHFLRKGNLTVLNLASDPSLRNLSTLPSWVPDWSSWCRAEPLIGFIYLAEKLYGPPSNKELASPPRVLNDHTVLVLKGSILDRVQRIGKQVPVVKRVSDRVVALRIVKQWRRLAGRQSKYTNGEAMDEAFARAVTLNMASEILEQHDYADLYRRYIAQFPRRRWAADVNQDGGHAKTYEFHNRMRTAAHLRTFFKTRNGLIGMGPYSLRPGDHVVDFEGGVTPYIIRAARNGCYKFIGDAYIHGLSNMGDGVYSTDICLV